ncbi:hypothetical protein V2G26_002126 [Clonostachys chloroleuca]
MSAPSVSSTDSDSSAAKIRWIAGPIVGGVVLLFLLILLWFFLRSRRHKEQRKKRIPRAPVRYDRPKPQREKQRPPQLQLHTQIPKPQSSTPRSQSSKTMTPMDKPLPQSNKSPPLYYKSPSQSDRSQPRSDISSPSETASIARSQSKGRGGGPAIWFHIHELPGSPSRWSWYKQQDRTAETSPSRWSWHRTSERPIADSPTQWSLYRQQEGPREKGVISTIEPIYELDDHEFEGRGVTSEQKRAPRAMIYEESPDSRLGQVSNTGQVFFI